MTTRIARYRRVVEGVGWVVFLAIPWIPVGADHLFRVDVTRPGLVLAGRTIGLDASVPIFFSLLAILTLSLLGVVVLGRLWCGWLCPQTLLSDLAESLEHRLGLHRRGVSSQSLRLVAWHGVLIIVASGLGVTTVGYFVGLPDLIDAATLSSPVLVGSLVVVAASIYVDTAFIRRHLCRTVCPYGRFQSTLVGSETLAVHFEQAPDNPCLSCEACVRVCPTGTDIRTGAQVQCIHCGRCVDVCADVLARRDRTGLIAYRWGTSDTPPKRMTIRTAVLSAATVLLVVAALVSAHRSEDVRLYVRRSPAPLRTTADGTTAIFFSAIAANRTQARHVVTVAGADAEGQPLNLKGQIESQELSPGERRRLSFAVLIDPPAGVSKQRLSFRLVPDSPDLVSEPVGLTVTIEPPTASAPASLRP